MNKILGKLISDILEEGLEEKNLEAKMNKAGYRVDLFNEAGSFSNTGRDLLGYIDDKMR